MVSNIRSGPPARDGLSLGQTVPTRTKHQEPVGYMGIESPIRSVEMMQILGLSLALLLFGSGIWANVGGGPLSQNKGAWVSRANQ
jgi:hypothetical protein